LRFRSDGKQRVRCLGSDPAVAASVTSALAELQQPKRASAQWKKLCRVGGRRLRAEKKQIAPLLATRGWKFHGHALRQSRSAAQGARATTGTSDSDGPSRSASERVPATPELGTKALNEC
jgi:hypothetical protein